MIGLITSALAFLAAAWVARHEPRHEPIRDALGIGLSYAFCATLDRSMTEHHPRLLLGMFASVALASGYAYQRAFAWKPAEGLMFAGTVALLILPALVTGRAHWWGLATWGPFVASSAFGGWALIRWHERYRNPLHVWTSLQGGGKAYEVIVDPWTITGRTALLLLASDVCMLLFVPWPGVQQWQGRASAVVVAGVQFWWLYEQRRTPRAV